MSEQQFEAGDRVKFIKKFKIGVYNIPVGREAVVKGTESQQIAGYDIERALVYVPLHVIVGKVPLNHLKKVE